jgi:hypothetical protein
METAKSVTAQEILALNDFVNSLPEDGILHGFFTTELLNAFSWAITGKGRIPLPTVIIPKEIAQAIEARNSPHPGWQTEMRRLQQERDTADLLEQEAKDREKAEREQALMEQVWQKAVARFQQIGFTAYPAAMPDNLEWLVDNYLLKLSSGGIWRFYIYRYMPTNGLSLLPDDYDGLYEYRDYVEENRPLNDITLIAIADMIDKVDNSFAYQLERNQHAVKSALGRIEYQAKRKAEAALEKAQPTATERLVELIREIAREEIEASVG